MSKTLNFNCGCSFKISDEQGILFDPNITTINLDCQKTWDLIGEGNTKGCFQLESRLGRSYAKKLKPENIEQLSALIAIIRPGCLESFKDGKSITQHYIDIKNGQESIDYLHQALEPVLKTTYSQMIYQEQAMQIAKDIAGFSLQDADSLRKAIGKKLPEQMAKIKTKFLEGCNKTQIVDTNTAEQIFGWIEKSQRYSFNKSHSVSYAMNAYLSAYAKAHFPRVFFASYLSFAKDKINPQDEIKELIQNANEMDVEVKPPDIRNLNRFFILKDDKIYFGLTDIKGVGQSVFDKMIKVISDHHVNINTAYWLQILFKVLNNINSIAAKALIQSGALDFTNIPRQKMLYEYNTISNLTKKEIEFCVANLSENVDLYYVLQLLLHKGKVSKNRKSNIENLLYNLANPPHSLEDQIEWVSDCEYNLLGYSLSCSKVDLYDISMTNTSCREFNSGASYQNIILGGEITGLNVTQTKTGKTKGSDMAFVTLQDNTAACDSVIFFPEAYKQYRNILFQGHVIIVQGTRSKNKDSLIVEKAYVART